MHLGVTLVRDNVANLRRFVDGNLAHGIDHLLVVHDGPVPAEVLGLLGAHPDVTLVVADDQWWLGDRLDLLNARQRVVANLARVVSTELGFVEWMFFLDGDEVALVDRAVLARQPADVRAVRLKPLESVADARGEARALFKRLLDKPDLQRLARAGVIPAPRNQVYFRGHVTGKTAIRPSHEVRSWIHAVVDESEEKVPLAQDPGLRHLHFESPTYDEFVRKWTALATSGSPPPVRATRAEVLETVLAARAEPSAEVREQRLRELYERVALDDVATLEAMGLLERVDVERPTSTPVRITEPQRAALVDALAVAARMPKRVFLPRTPTSDVLAAWRVSS